MSFGQFIGVFSSSWKRRRYVSFRSDNLFVFHSKHCIVECVYTNVSAVVLIQVCDILDDLLVDVLLVRLFPGEGQDLPEGHGKRPDIAARCVLSL